MAVTVVIPVWNGLEHVKANFPAVLALGANEIIAIDDASADGVGDHIKKAFPQVKILTNVVNLRFPKSVNKAVKAASGDFIILLNQDVLPDKHLLKNVFPHFSDSRVFAVTFNEQHQSWAKVEINNGRLEHINGELDNQIHHSFWASGAGSAFRKSVWRELGGFDDTARTWIWVTGPANADMISSGNLGQLFTTLQSQLTAWLYPKGLCGISKRGIFCWSSGKTSTYLIYLITQSP